MSKVLLKDNPLDPGRGHQYTRDDGKEYCEFHEDYIVNVFKESEDETRTMSVRAPTGSKKLEIIGQDESVIVQFLINSKHWSMASGQRVLLPKSEGDGRMILRLGWGTGCSSRLVYYG